MSDRRKLCTFRIDRQWFGVEVAGVQEVLRSQPMARVRWAGATLRGLINLRGQIVTAVDLRPALGIVETAAESPAAAAPHDLDHPGHASPGPQVVVRAPGAGQPSLSLCVDEIGDVADVDSSQFERAPATYVVARPDLVRGVYKMKDRLLLALDLTRVMHAVTPQGASE